MHLAHAIFCLDELVDRPIMWLITFTVERFIAVCAASQKTAGAIDDEGADRASVAVLSGEL